MLRTIESFELEGTFKGHLVQLPCNLQLNQVLRAPSSPTLNISKDGTSTTSLGNLNQCLTTPIKKAFFLVSSLNLFFFSLEAYSLCPITQTQLKSLSPFLYPLVRYALRSPGAFPSAGCTAQLSACPHREVFHPWAHFCGPPLDALQQLHVSPVLSTPHLDAVLQVRSHSTEQRGRSPPSPCWPRCFGCSPGCGWLSGL